jgi:hypothetical protein
VINEQEAIERAKQIAEEQGWIWVEPAEAIWHPAWSGSGGKWEIFSNARGLGAKARVVIDAQTGAVLEKGYVPR